MGEFTELQFGAVLRENTPPHVIEILQRALTGECFSSEDDPHPFFSSERSWLLSAMANAYFPYNGTPAFNKGIYDQWTLCFRASLKNYDHEIEKFLNWIAPYVELGSGKYQHYATVIKESGDTTIYTISEPKRKVSWVVGIPVLPEKDED